MRKIFERAGLLLAAAAVPAVPALAAQGTPQRSDQVPPGLLRVLASGNPGILTAIMATEGSNSRLQDLPVSP